jgi:hypothetical protein
LYVGKEKLKEVLIMLTLDEAERIVKVHKGRISFWDIPTYLRQRENWESMKDIPSTAVALFGKAIALYFLGEEDN